MRIGVRNLKRYRLRGTSPSRVPMIEDISDRF
jgi:hypothetical protein